MLGGSPPGSSPNVFSGLKIWNDVTQETGYTDNTTLTSIKDWSGNGKDMTTIAGTPKYRTGGPNGQPYFEFNALSENVQFQNIGGTAVVAAGAHTAFGVIRRTNGSTGYPFMLTETGVTQKADFSFNAGDGKWHADGYDGAVRTTAGFTATLNQWYILSMWHTGGNLYMGCTDTRDASAQSVACGNLSINANDDLYYGDPNGAGNTADLTECIWYNVALAESDRKAVEQRLAWKYGITLPY